MRKPIVRAAATLLLAAPVLSWGCQAVLPGQGEPPKLYDLSPKSTFPKDLPEVDWQLVVDTPVAAASINTTRIALKRQHTTMQYYSRSLWTDVAPRLVQTLLIESFENTKKIVSVGRESASLRSDYLLQTELREFVANYKGASGPPDAVVRINAKLVKMPQRTIIAGTTVGYEIPAASDNLDDIVEAFDEALGKTLKQIVIWTLNAPRKAG